MVCTDNHVRAFFIPTAEGIQQVLWVIIQFESGYNVVHLQIVRKKYVHGPHVFIGDIDVADKSGYCVVVIFLCQNRSSN